MTLKADTLVLRNGTRVQGELVGGPRQRDRVRRAPRLRQRPHGPRSIATRSFESSSIRLRTTTPTTAVVAPTRAACGGRPVGLRERQVNVASNVPWVDAGIDVRAGQTVYFEAARRSALGAAIAAMVRRARRTRRTTRTVPIPSRAAGSLIGKVGNENNDFFYIGADTGPVRMRSGGRLYLGVNDDFLQDNSRLLPGRRPVLSGHGEATKARKHETDCRVSCFRDFVASRCWTADSESPVINFPL